MTRAKQSGNCEKCGGLLPVRVFGLLVGDGTIREFCSQVCKDTRAAAAPEKAKRSRLKKQPRTPGEIKKAMRATEGQNKRHIQDDLDRHGVFNLRLNSGAIQTKGGHWIQLCKPGTPDNFFLDGVPVFIEVKKENEQPSTEQLERHAEIKKSGGLVFVVDSVADYEFIRVNLKNYQRYVGKIRQIVADIQSEMDRKINEKE